MKPSSTRLILADNDIGGLGQCCRVPATLTWLRYVVQYPANPAAVFDRSCSLQIDDLRWWSVALLEVTELPTLGGRKPCRLTKA